MYTINRELIQNLWFHCLYTTHTLVDITLGHAYTCVKTCAPDRDNRDKHILLSIWNHLLHLIDRSLYWFPWQKYINYTASFNVANSTPSLSPTHHVLQYLLADQVSTCIAMCILFVDQPNTPAQSEQPPIGSPQ